MPEIINSKINQKNLKKHLEQCFGDMVKFVVDVEKGILALGGEMHADCEDVLLATGSRQQDLWGANFYPDRPLDKCFEYTSLINIKPSVGNRDMYIQDKGIREKVKRIAESLLLANND